jgi:hypothetical protein
MLQSQFWSKNAVLQLEIKPFLENAKDTITSSVTTEQKVNKLRQVHTSSNGTFTKWILFIYYSQQMTTAMRNHLKPQLHC